MFRVKRGGDVSYFIMAKMSGSIENESLSTEGMDP